LDLPRNTLTERSSNTKAEAPRCISWSSSRHELATTPSCLMQRVGRMVFAPQRLDNPGFLLAQTGVKSRRRPTPPVDADACLQMAQALDDALASPARIRSQASPFPYGASSVRRVC
jgi:hypothetical protein